MKNNLIHVEPNYKLHRTHIDDVSAYRMNKGNRSYIVFKHDHNAWTFVGANRSFRTLRDTVSHLSANGDY